MGQAASNAALGATALEGGRCVDRYILLRELGRGGMGVVFEAHDPRLGRNIALKLLREDGGGSQGSLTSTAPRARLLSEARAMASITHPNVVPVYDVGEVGEHVFIAMELIRGLDLAAWARRTQPRRKELLKVLIAAGRGLEAVHRGGLLHRDFKPDNVLVGEDGLVRILDFGLALAGSGEYRPSSPTGTEAGYDSQSQTTAVTHDIAGTPSYMAPEQHAGEPLTPSCDQYAFCVAAFELLVGRKPFAEADGRSLAEVKCSGLLAAPGVPRHIFRILQRGLAPEPLARYPDMVSLLRELGDDPQARLRRTVASVLAIAGLVGTMGQVVLEQARAGERCRAQHFRKQTRAVWSSRETGRLHEGVRRLGGGSALRHTAHAVSRRLEARLEDWVDHSVELCQRSHEHHRLVASSLQSSCLATRLDETKDFVAGLRPLRAEALHGAVQALSKLPSPASCANVETLSAREPIPNDPKAQAAVADVRRRLKAIDHRGKNETSASPVAQLLVLRDEAHHLGFVPLLAEIELNLGTVVSELHSLEAGLEHTAAAHAFAEASGHDYVATMALGDQIFVRGYLMEQFTVADQLYRHAAAHVERAGSPLELTAELSRAAAPMLAVSGRGEQSAANMREVVEAYHQLFGYEDPRTAIAYNNLGIALNGIGNRTEGLSSLRQSVEILERLLGESHPELRLSLCNFVLELRYAGNWIEATTYARRAQEIQRLAGNPDDELAGLCARQIGTLATLMDNAELGLRSLEQATAITRKLHGEDSLVPLRDRAELLEAQVRLEQSEAAAATAQVIQATLAELGGEGPHWLPGIYFSLARWSFSRGRLHDAAGHLAIAAEYVPPDRDEALDWAISVALLRSQLALAEGHSRVAGVELETALASRRELGAPETANDVELYEAQAAWAIAQRDPDAAYEFLARARDLLAPQVHAGHRRLRSIQAQLAGLGVGPEI